MLPNPFEDREHLFRFGGVESFGAARAQSEFSGISKKREPGSAREFLQDSARGAKRDLLLGVLERLRRSSASDQQQLVRSWTPGKGVNSIAAPTAVDLVLPGSWFDGAHAFRNASWRSAVFRLRGQGEGLTLGSFRQPDAVRGTASGRMHRTEFSLFSLRLRGREAETFAVVCMSTTPLLHTDLKEILNSGYSRTTRILGALGLWISLRVAELHPADLGPHRFCSLCRPNVSLPRWDSKESGFAPRESRY